MPKSALIVAILIVLAAVIIRVATGGTHLIYNALGDRGIFPGPLAYTLLYFVRLLLCSVMLSYYLFSYCIYEDRIKIVLPAFVAVILLLLEYRMIFGGISLVLSVVFSALCAVLILVTVMTSRYKNKYISVLMILFVVLQAVHFVQLISLAVCI